MTFLRSIPALVICAALALDAHGDYLSRELDVFIPVEGLLELPDVPVPVSSPGLLLDEGVRWALTERLGPALKWRGPASEGDFYVDTVASRSFGDTDVLCVRIFGPACFDSPAVVVLEKQKGGAWRDARAYTVSGLNTPLSLNWLSEQSLRKLLSTVAWPQGVRWVEGNGECVRLEGRLYSVIAADWMRQHGVEPSEIEEAISSQKPSTISWVAHGGLRWVSANKEFCFYTDLGGRVIAFQPAGLTDEKPAVPVPATPTPARCTQKLRADPAPTPTTFVTPGYELDEGLKDRLDAAFALSGNIYVRFAAFSSVWDQWSSADPLEGEEENAGVFIIEFDCEEVRKSPGLPITVAKQRRQPWSEASLYQTLFYDGRAFFDGGGSFLSFVQDAKRFAPVGDIESPFVEASGRWLGPHVGLVMERDGITRLELEEAICRGTVFPGPAPGVVRVVDPASCLIVVMDSSEAICSVAKADPCDVLKIFKGSNVLTLEELQECIGEGRARLRQDVSKGNPEQPAPESVAP